MGSEKLIVWLLTAAATFSIFAGFALALRTTFSSKERGFWIAYAVGFLLFVLFALCARVWGDLHDLFVASFADYPDRLDFWAILGVFVAGLTAGFLFFLFLETRLFGRAKDLLLPLQRAKEGAFLMAVHAGCLAFAKGLSIGAALAWKEYGLAALLGSGFLLNQIAQGIVIVAPLGGQLPGNRFLFLWGLIGGLPLALGVFLASFMHAAAMVYFCWALACGVILFAVTELLHEGRYLKEEFVTGVGLLTGFLAACLAHLGFLLHAIVLHGFYKG